jgi:CRP-like cAMP-binding protein
MALTSITVAAIDAEDALTDLMACRPMALYIAWLLGQRQRRADRLLAAISCLDARGRLATMLLDFYMRLHRRRLIIGSIYNLPLTQNPNRKLPRADWGARQSHVAILACRTDRQAEKAYRDDPRS